MKLKVTVAQITSDPACFEENFHKISNAITKAKSENSQLVVFPELALCGYAHLDLAKRDSFLKSNQEYLQRLLPLTKNLAVIIGFVDADFNTLQAEGKPILYNSAAVIENGILKSIIRKQLLPTYDIFFEERYFRSGAASKVITIAGVKVGIGICEDLWDQGYNRQIYENLIADGAELLVNISASPFEPAKLSKRLDLVQQLGELPFIYTNLTGSFDGYDGEVVFDGQSFISGTKGKLFYLAPACQESISTVDLSVSEQITFNLENPLKEITQALILGIREYFRRSGLKRAYIGLSGGIDSALTVALAVQALGPTNVIGITMPSEVTSKETKSDAHLVANNLGIKIEERPIKSMYQNWLTDFRQIHGFEPERLTKQNIQARFRGMILMEYTNQDRDGLVLSTGNKTELALGYCTMYGDMCGGLAVIADLSKLKVYQLSDYINKSSHKELIPQTTIDRLPTAELELDQTDADNLPADYDILSPLVDDLVDHELSLDQLELKYDPRIIRETARLLKINEFKRRQAAPGIRVTGKAFGVGRRIPISHGSY